MFIILISILNFLQPDVPFKPKTDFEVKLDLKFKQRPQVGTDGYSANGTKLIRDNGGVLPYLIVNFKVLKLDSGELKVRVSSNRLESIISKKVEVNDVLPMDLGFMEDVKDKVTANTYTVLFLSAKRVPLSKVIIEIDAEGNFFVNNEKRGKI